MHIGGRHPRLLRRVGEAPVPVVAQQAQSAGRRADHDVEIAVVIDVDKCGRPGRHGNAREAGALRDVAERAVGLLMEQSIAAIAQHEEIRTSVVVVVCRDDAARRRPVELRCARRTKAAARVVPHDDAAIGDGDEIELAIAVHVGERDTADPA